MKVIATAGHVDHGKSALVLALSGIDPDRLREEKTRGMTIDLGFAWIMLEGGEEVGIVDVPGHIDFIKNMLSGVGGVDAALFVIAADEGVMPQTSEHLAILDLLEVPRGLIALTKIDLVDDSDWLLLVEEDIRDTLSGTVLEDAEIVPVSAMTGEGIDRLRQALGSLLTKAPPRLDLGRPRLPIDRAFSIAGFGTVVTGTLLDGTLHLGEEMVIVPGEIRSRIRGLQSHKTKIEVAQPGSRVAVNLSGIHPDQIQRGQVLTVPGLFRGTKRVDVRLRALADAPVALKHNMEVTFHSGAAEALGRLRLLEDDTLQPGQDTWAQIALRDPVAVARGDHYIIRRPSPSNTLGGGVVVDPAPRRQHRRRRQEIFQHLEVLKGGDPADLLEGIIHARGPITGAAAIYAVDLPDEQLSVALTLLSAEGRIESLETGKHEPLYVTSGGWALIRRRLHDLLEAYHQQYPLRRGMPREEVKSRLQPREGWATVIFNAILARARTDSIVAVPASHIALPDFHVVLTPAQQQAAKRLMQQFKKQPYAPPTVKQSLEWVSEDVLIALLHDNQFIRVAEDVLFEKQTFDEMVAKTRTYIEQHGQITVGECRDLFDTSRKYVLGFLEYLDQQRITRRDGDKRVLR